MPNDEPVITPLQLIGRVLIAAGLIAMLPVTYYLRQEGEKAEYDNIKSLSVGDIKNKTERCHLMGGYAFHVSTDGQTTGIICVKTINIEVGSP